MHAHPDRLVIVGPGRLGRSVARLLEGGARTVELVGRGQPIPAAPLTWLTVPDRVIAEVAARVPAGGIVLHASGATEIDALRPHQPAGSLHPLMTFPGPEVALPSEPVPAAVAGDPEARAAATALAAELGWRAFEVSGDRRLYHASAVIAGNFATALLGEAARVLAAAGVDPAEAPALLAPLARQSLANAALHGPAQTLTGPVARGDEVVIEAHRQALAEAAPEVLEVYEIMLAATRALVEA